MTHVLPISFSLNGQAIAIDVPAHTLLIDPGSPWPQGDEALL
ncbi:hypothetical protein ABIF65_009884 [Bradyrhizobium japonicum]|jgi:hypothetical protein|nr:MULTISPECIES: hypothetical protein [Bradyrhizobium]MCP1747922.1 hypothetical protein [Bradyrhizobium japonicum]MCP1864800.1 hypothetical protein [Bradyrhizobium japonicum]MCP1896427.1 hypothetical protein [Bradyrhizobium japonicum]MCW2329814.1 hypothetical protein [Bradyrhizobium japonicum]